MKILNNRFRLCLIYSTLLCVSACSTLNQNDSLDSQRLNDPLEGLNRSIYSFNTKADKAILKPVAKAYKAVIPDPAERGIGRFFSNLNEPFNIMNNLLQGKVDRALSSTYRFAVNSTVGLLGFFDVAKSYEVEKKPEDFGQTLAAWGAKPGPYIMLPLLGPSNLRDGLAQVTSLLVLDPTKEITNTNDQRIGLTALSIVDVRAGLLGTDDTLYNQLDPYLFLKEAVESNRINAIYDGNSPETDDNLDF